MDVDDAFNFERRHSSNDYADYLRTRPYIDDVGRIRAPLTDSIVDPNEYYAQQREFAASNSPKNLPYENLELSELVDRMGEAQAYNDLTTLHNAQEALAERLPSSGVRALGRMLAHAEFKDSSVAADVITDSLLDELVAQEEAQSKAGESTKDRNMRSDHLINYALAVKENELNKLRVESPHEDQAAPEQYKRESPDLSTGEPKVDEAASVQDEGSVFRGKKRVYYDSANGSSPNIALEYTEPGAVMDWQKSTWTRGHHRQILLTDEEGKQYYVKDLVIYDLAASREQQREISWEDEDLAHLPPAVIGEGWKITDDHVTKPITKVEVLSKAAQPVTADTENYRGADPFLAADQLIVSLQNKGGETSSNQPLNFKQAATTENEHNGRNQQRPLSLRERLRNRRAARRAGGLSLAGAGAYLSNTRTRAREWLRNDPNGQRRALAIVAGILAAGAVVGIAYLVAKGLLNVEDHHNHRGVATSPVPGSENGATNNTHHAPGTTIPHHPRVHEDWQDTTVRSGNLSHSGSTIWGNEEARYRHYHPDWSRQQVYAHASRAANHILRVMHITPEDARHLPVGYQYER